MAHSVTTAHNTHKNDDFISCRELETSSVAVVDDAPKKAFEHLPTDVSFVRARRGRGRDGGFTSGRCLVLFGLGLPKASHSLPPSPASASLSSWGPIGRRRCLCATAPPAPRCRGGHGVIQGQQVAKDITRALPRWRTGDPPPPLLLHAARALLHAEREKRETDGQRRVGEWEKYNSRRNEPDERLIGANNL